MKRLRKASVGLFTSIVLVVSFLLVPSIHATDITLPKDTTVRVFFSPNGGCTEAIIDTINQSKSEILVQAYIFTSEPIAKALLGAHNGESRCLSSWIRARKRMGTRLPHSSQPGHSLLHRFKSRKSPR